jgi:uroporphyrin-III C-methyltransferase/precorrin-2 dehydrogenase/sirohydrochlorin ferrochelatase
MTGSSPIGPLAILPLFHRLAGRKAVVAGSSEGSGWKAELLTAAGADVLHLPSDWTEEMLAGAALAVGDFPDSGEARRFAEAAHRAGALVNIIDQPDLSDTQFGTIVNRSPVVIGISTDGGAPILGQSIRARIESVLPLGLAGWGRAAKQWRPRLRRSIAAFGERRSFWQRFVAAAWAQPDRAPTESDFEQLLAGTPAARGKISLVGAGPGDPELLTLKAVRALQSATFILHDQLVGPGVLELARREARRIPVGKMGHGPSCKQDDINRMLTELALAGENVVRLKGGDPMIFGRAAEEIDACRNAGIDVEVIPGISAAQAAAASLLMSLTERARARRVQFVTGHGADGKLPTDIDWISIADRGVTTVLYMPRRTLEEFVRKALSKGLDPATPAIAIASVSLPDEMHAAGQVAEIGALVTTLPASAPIVIVVGWVARRHVRAAPAVISFPEAVAS